MKKAIMAALALGLSGCATTYTAPDFEEYRASHETVAILPFDVAINASTQGKNAPSQEELDAIEAQQAEIFQRALYVQFLESRSAASTRSIFRT